MQLQKNIILLGDIKLKQTSILTPQMLYNDDGFLHWLVRLQPFHSETGNPPMTANQFYWATRLQMECGGK